MHTQSPCFFINSFKPTRQYENFTLVRVYLNPRVRPVLVRLRMGGSAKQYIFKSRNPKGLKTHRHPNWPRWTQTLEVFVLRWLLVKSGSDNAQMQV